jgi:hypothetical protein
MASDLPDAPEPSMASLVGGVVEDAQLLIKQELALAKREVTDGLNKAKAVAIIVCIGIGIVAEGGLLLVLVLVYLLFLASSERVPLWGCGAIAGASVSGNNTCTKIQLHAWRTIASSFGWSTSIQTDGRSGDCIPARRPRRGS